jgi:hypothetical protein
LFGLGVLAVLFLGSLIISVKRLTLVLLEQRPYLKDLSKSNASVFPYPNMMASEMMFHPHSHSPNFIQPAFLIGTTDIELDEDDDEGLDEDTVLESWEVDLDAQSESWNLDGLPEDLQYRLRTFQNTLANLQERVVADSHYRKAAALPDDN